MVVHQLARAGRVADLDQLQQLAVHVVDAARHLGVQRRIAARPRHVLQRDQLHHQHAVVRGLRHREVKLGAELREALGVVDRGVRVVDQLRASRDVRLGGVLGGELRGEAFDGALRVHDLGGADAGEVELHGERLGEQPRVAARDPRAAALAHLDLDDAQRLAACAARRARRCATTS